MKPSFSALSSEPELRATLDGRASLSKLSKEGAREWSKGEEEGRGVMADPGIG
jgi:hypothetical protein